MAGYGYHGSAAAEQSFSQGNQYMVQGAMMQAQGITNAAQSVSQSIRDIRKMSMENDEMQMRVQSHQVEMELNRQKLADMQAIDMVTRSRKELEMMDENISAARQQRQIAQDEYDYRKQQRGIQETDAEIAREGKMLELETSRIIAGTHYRDDNGQLKPAKTPAEKSMAKDQAKDLQWQRTMAERQQTFGERTTIQGEMFKERQFQSQEAQDAWQRSMGQEELYLKQKQQETMRQHYQMQDMADLQRSTSGTSQVPAGVQTEAFRQGQLILDKSGKLKQPVTPEEIASALKQAEAVQKHPSLQPLTAVFSDTQAQIDELQKKLTTNLMLTPDQKTEMGNKLKILKRNAKTLRDKLTEQYGIELLDPDVKQKTAEERMEEEVMKGFGLPSGGK